MAQKKFVSIAKLETFLGNLRNTFAPMSHKHKLSDISDYEVDTTLSSASNNPISNKTVKTSIDTINSNISTKANSLDLTSHTGDKSNPHGVTASQIGLGNVDNTSDINKPISAAVQNALDNKSDVGHTHNVVTTSTNGFMSAADKKTFNALIGTDYSLGNMAGKTVGELRTALENWLGNIKYIPNATTSFAAGTDWIYNWNLNDLTSILSAGNLWTVRVSGMYSTEKYVQLEISTYNAKGVYYCVLRNKTWDTTVRHVAFTDDIDTSLESAKSYADSKVTNMNKEAYLTWGGRNIAGDYGCIDAAMIPDLGANRLAFGNANGITVEYSRDGGNTWTDYGLSDENKRGLFGAGYSASIGKADSSNKATADYMLRVTIDTLRFGVYTALNKFAIYLSINGSTGCYCTIDASLKNTPTNFTVFANKVSVNGWSGWNIINTSNIVTYGNDPSGQYGLLRFTFGCTGGSTQYYGLLVTRIMGFGGVGWVTPSNLAKYGTIYSYDNNQNVNFPAKVTASNGGFSGSLTGNASTASAVKDSNNGNMINITYNKTPQSSTSRLASWNEYELGSIAPSSLSVGSATKLTSSAGSSTQPVYFSDGKPVACSYTLSKSVPSNAVFTDTVYTHPASSGSKHIPSGGSSGQILRWSADGTAVWGNDNNTTYSNFVKSGSGAKAGLVPAPSTTAGSTKYLREDGTWAVPPNTNTTYSNFKGATSSSSGSTGLVPAPSSGQQNKFLRGDGTWATTADEYKTFDVVFSKNGFSSLLSFPSGYNSSNCYVDTVLIQFNDCWRTGSGCIASGDRYFAQITPSGIQAYLYAYEGFDSDSTTISMKIILKKF